ncbi:Protein translocase subunit SecD [subsurface metagenome]
MEKYLDSLTNETVYDILINEFTFHEVQEREINFGLDLKGGMSVILEISTVDVIRALANNNKDTTFLNAINIAREMQKKTNKDFITLFGEAFEQVDPGASLSAIFTSQELRDKVKPGTPNDEVLEIIREEAHGAIDNAFNIIRTRIDQFGVTQPNIQYLDTKDRILVDLPGVKNKDRVRRLLQGTANLEFWETFENAELIQNLYATDAMVREYQATQKELKKDTTEEKSPVVDAVPVQEDATESSSLMAQIRSDTTLQDTIPQTIEETYPLLSILMPMQDPQNRQPYPGAVIGIARLKDTTKINYYLRLAQERKLFPREVRFMWSALPDVDQDKKPTDRYKLYAIKVRSRDGLPPLDGDVIVSARQEFDETSGFAYVLMNMNAEGSKKWAHITKENLKKVICVVSCRVVSLLI